MDVPWCFKPQKEADHGEGGTLVGSLPAGRSMLVDDVMSSLPAPPSANPWI